METNGTTKKETKTNPKKSTHSSLRVSKPTWRLAQQKLDEANDKQFGRRVKMDKILAVALPKLTPEDMKEIQESSLSNQDRFDREYVRYVSQHGKVSRDEYLGRLMSGTLAASAETKKTTENG